MTVSFNLPQHIEQDLRLDLGDLDQTAKESTLVELFRQGKLSHGAFAEALGISRYEADGVLKRYNVTEDLLTLEEFQAETAALRKLLGE